MLKKWAMAFVAPALLMAGAITALAWAPEKPAGTPHGVDLKLRLRRDFEELVDMIEAQGKKIEALEKRVKELEKK